MGQVRVEALLHRHSLRRSLRHRRSSHAIRLGSAVGREEEATINGGTRVIYLDLLYGYYPYPYPRISVITGITHTRTRVQKSGGATPLVWTEK